MPCEREPSAAQDEKPQCPFTTKGVYVSRLLRFIHMLTHIPLGFGDFGWAIRIHDATGDVWEEYESPSAGMGRPPTIQALLRAMRSYQQKGS